MMKIGREFNVTDFVQNTRECRISMRFSMFNAFTKFEVGDKVRKESGEVMTITDIACIYYNRSKRVEFRFEFDNSGKYVLMMEK
jgi:uncharacterized protein YodC (DUF2158 family)